MSMKKNQRNIFRHELERKVREKNINDIDGLLNLIFGEHGHEWQNEYILKYRHFDKDKTTAMNRLNCFWVFPVFLAIAPFRYIVFGEYRMNEDSKFYKIIAWLVGER